MNKEYITIAAHRILDSLPGTHSDDIYLNACFFSKMGKR